MMKLSTMQSDSKRVFQFFKSIFFGILAQAFKQGDVSRGSQNSTDTGDVSEGVAVHQPLSTTFLCFRFGGWESCLDIFLSFHLCCGCDCHMRTPALADQVGYINVFATHTADPMRASKALFSVMDLPFDGTQSSQRDQHLPQFRSASSLVASIGARELNHSVPVGIPAGIPAGTP